MAFSTSISYQERNMLDIKSLMRAARVIFIHGILALILLFLAIEEIDWAIFSFREKINVSVTDKTSWNIKTILNF